MATVIGLGIGVLLFIGAAAVFSPALRARLRRALAPIAVAVIALVLLASYIDHT